MTDDTLTALEAAQAEIARLRASCAALEASNAARDDLIRWLGEQLWRAAATLAIAAERADKAELAERIHAWLTDVERDWPVRVK